MSQSLASGNFEAARVEFNGQASNCSAMLPNEVTAMCCAAMQCRWVVELDRRRHTLYFSVVCVAGWWLDSGSGLTGKARNGSEMR